ncbi:MAG: DUF2848 domain-containing protein [Hyphomicrobiales bacterium]|nr:DUF2848 domain-containing protein [Hyphomicrobiales bacterium]
MGVHSLTFRAYRGGRVENRSIVLDSAIIAGWTGRDPVAREKHIAELEALGVARPASTPIYYRVSRNLLTTADQIEVVGESSSGEVEFVLIRDGSRLWLGVGSDHTDRKMETYNVTVSKQLCEKPIASELWDFEEVVPHWDSLQLRSWIEQDGELRLYQEGPVTSMLAPQDIIGGCEPGGTLREGTAMFCGTLAAKGGIRPSKRFCFELSDPVFGRRIAHSYVVVALPIVG